MSLEPPEPSVLIEKIRSNDTWLGSELDCLDLSFQRGMTFSVPSTMTDHSLACVDCRATDDSFAQFIEALKVNTTLTYVDLGGTFKLCRVFCYD